MALNAPSTPVQTAPVKTRYTGTTAFGSRDLEVALPIALGATTADDQAAAAWLKAQFRVYLNQDEGTEAEDWEDLPQLDPIAREVVIPNLEGTPQIDIRVFAISADGVPSAALLVEAYALFGNSPAPDDVILERIYRTDAAGSRSGIKATWTSEPDSWTQVRYRKDELGWIDAPMQVEDTFEVFPLESGRYQLEFRGALPTGALSDPTTAEITIASGESPFEIPRPSGLELVSAEGVLLGSERVVTCRDLKIRWNSVRVDDIQTDVVGNLPEDGLLENVVVQISSPEGLFSREEILPISVSEWVYPYGLAVKDIPLLTDAFSKSRMLHVRLAFKDKTGRLGPWTPMLFQENLILSDTQDVQEEAVNEIIVLTDFDEIEADEDYGMQKVLLSVPLLGQGFPVIFDYSDTFTYADAGFYFGEDLRLIFYITLRDTTNVVDISTLVITTLRISWLSERSAFSGGGNVPDWIVFDSVRGGGRIIETLQEGIDYEFEVAVARERDGVSSEFVATSTSRQLTIQTVKR